VDLAYRWSYLFIALVAPLLAWLLAAGRLSLRHTARLLAGAAVLVLLVEFVALLVEYSPWVGALQVSQLTQQSVAFFVGLAVANVAGSVSGLLAGAAWVVLLIEAVRAGRRARLVTLTLVYGGALALGDLTSAEVSSFNLFHDPLQQWFLLHFLSDPLLVQLGLALLVHSTTVAVLVCAFLLPPVVPQEAFAAASPAVPSGPRTP